ncbi:hypothetical protein PBN151_2106 [Paenibacillus sp. NAIST15-1]|nr:hypothetical protein PBN151_2106 [Paenibacillus sp. NAIST15-1]
MWSAEWSIWMDAVLGQAIGACLIHSYIKNGTRRLLNFIDDGRAIIHLYVELLHFIPITIVE